MDCRNKGRDGQKEKNNKGMKSSHRGYWLMKGNSGNRLCTHHFSSLHSEARRADHFTPFFFKIFFFIWTISKVFTEFFLQYGFCFIFYFFGLGACGILATHPPCTGRWSLNHWTIRDVRVSFHLEFFFSSHLYRTVSQPDYFMRECLTAQALCPTRLLCPTSVCIWKSPAACHSAHRWACRLHAVFCPQAFPLSIPSADCGTHSPLFLVWLILTYSW